MRKALGIGEKQGCLKKSRSRSYKTDLQNLIIEHNAKATKRGVIIQIIVQVT